jgi:hypothetical protein
VKIEPHDRYGSAHYTIQNPTFDGPCECGAKHPPGKLIAWLAGGLGDADIVRNRPERARHDPSTLADAHLIAASPTMRDGLAEFVGWVQNNPRMTPTLDDVRYWADVFRAALRAAEGKHDE